METAGSTPEGTGAPNAAPSAGVGEGLRPRVELLYDLLERKKALQAFKKFERHMPWPKQRVACNSKHRVIAIMGGNRTGKSLTGSYWCTAHITGRYPDWWEGNRYTSAVDGWAVGKTLGSTRDIIQFELLGDIRKPGGLGTGMIPKELIVDIRMAAGMPDVVDTIYVKHEGGGIGALGLKSGEQGQGKLMGTKKKFVWLDEEPERNGYGVFSELRTRTATEPDGQILVTYTPLQGMNELARYILTQDDPGILLVNITLADAAHLTPEQREEMVRGWLPHEREARELGKPIMADGAVFPFSESQMTCEPFSIPEGWPIVAGMDVGMATPTCVVWWAKDPSTGIRYAFREYAAADTLRETHAKNIRGVGEGVYIAVDPSANRREGDGKRTMQVYRSLGLNVANANNDVQHGIMTWHSGFADGTVKIFRNLTGLLEEIRFYQYENGAIKKVRDHRIDAGRYGLTAMEHARPLAWFAQRFRQNQVRGLNVLDRHVPGDVLAGY